MKSKRILSFLLAILMIATLFPSSYLVTVAKAATVTPDEFVNFACNNCVGIPYVSGGRSTSGFDCCGLVWYVCNHFGINIGNGNQRDQLNYGTPVSYSLSSYNAATANLQKGDLIFFDYDCTPPAASSSDHVAIYLGDGEILQAHTYGVNSKVDKLTGGWLQDASGSWIPEWKLICGIRRVLTGGSTPEHTCNTNGGYAFYEAAHPHYSCYYCSICGKATRNYNETNYLSSCAECNPDTPSVADTIDCYRKVQLPARKVNLYWNPTDTSPATYFDYGPTIRSATYAKMTDGSIMYKADVNHQGTDTQMWFKYESDMQVTVYHTYGSVQYEYDHPHKAYKTCACGNTSYTGDYGTRDDCTSCRLLDSGNCGDQGDNVTWTLDRDGRLTISGSGAMKDYSTFVRPVPWCSNRETIKSVTIENGVTNIGESAFVNCTGLVSINIPDGVTSIGSDAFSGCTGLTSINIPDGVTSIGSAAFKNCTGLTSISIPDGVTSIGINTFDNCTGLVSINIPDGVTSIGSCSFYHCTGLTNINIPDGVTSIGDCAFYHCTGLTNINIPDGVTSIGISVFADCTGLTSINIPDGVTSIGISAFENCTGLMSIDIPDGVTSIGNCAFENCTGLMSIDIPDGVTSIELRTFENCTSLRDITISNPNCTIGDRDGTLGVSNYTTIHGYPGSTAQSYADKYSYAFAFLTIASGTCGDNLTWILDTAGTLTIYGSGAMDLPYGPPWGEHSEAIKVVNITSGVTSIEYNAFADCSNLTRATISDSVVRIGKYAFSCCTALTNITIPSSITEIGWGAFSDCTNLVSVTIENGVTKIEGTAFCDCTSLQNIVIPSSITEIEFRTFSGCTALTSVTIPDGVTTIGESAFEGCTGLTSVTISDSVTKISSAFASCSSLTSIFIPSSVCCIDSNAFIHCDSLNTIEVASDNVNYSSWDGVLFNKQRTILHCYPAGRSGKYVIPNGVTQIRPGAFWRCHGLTSVIIPDSVTTIGQSAFFDCSSLLDITILNPNCTIGDEYPVEDSPLLGEPNYTTVYGYSGSTAQAYAATHGYAFSALDQDPENPPEPTQNPFTDVSANAYYYTPVLWAVSNDITSGTSATTFSPDAGCTRAQVVAFLWRAAGKPEPKQSSNPFADVRDGQYYYKAVLWAVEHGITAGTSATTFSPDATCTRGQIVSFLWRYEGKPAANARNPFTDVKPGAYYEPAVLWAVANGVTAGTSATTFSPDATCTRAQVVSFLYRDLAK